MFSFAVKVTDLVCFIVFCEVVHIIVTGLAIYGSVKEIRKLLVLWLIVTWVQFLALSIAVIIAVTFANWQLLVDGLTNFIMVGFVYYIVLKFYNVYVENFNNTE